MDWKTLMCLNVAVTAEPPLLKGPEDERERSSLMQQILQETLKGLKRLLGQLRYLGKTGTSVGTAEGNVQPKPLMHYLHRGVDPSVAGQDMSA